MKTPSNSAKPVVQAQLRRTAKSKSAAQFEVVLDGKVLDSRGSDAHDFHGALMGQSPDTKWSRISYHATPQTLASALRKAQRELKWPVQFLVATIIPTAS